MSARLSLPLAEWPQVDRLAWQQALDPDDEFFSEGAAERLRPDTRQSYVRSYGDWLAWLVREDELSPNEGPSDRPTRDRLARWMAEHRDRNMAPTARRQMLRNLSAILRLMDPQAGLTFLTRPGGRPLNKVIPGKARPFVVRDVADVLVHVRKLHAQGLAAAPGPTRWRALRDAALMAIFLTRGTRVGSVSRMILDQHLWQNAEDSWGMRFASGDTKNHRRLEYPLDAEASKMVTDYLRLARPNFPGAALSERVWMGMRGPMTINGLKLVPRQRTLEWFGHAHGPHACRKWLRSTAGRRGPELALDAAEVLGHSMEVSVASYTEANNLHAALRHRDHVGKLRARTEGIAERAMAERLKQLGEDFSVIPQRIPK